MRFNVFFLLNGVKRHEVIQTTYNDPEKIKQRIMKKYAGNEVEVYKISKINSAEGPL